MVKESCAASSKQLRVTLRKEYVILLFQPLKRICSPINGWGVSKAGQRFFKFALDIMLACEQEIL